MKHNVTKQHDNSDVAHDNHTNHHVVDGDDDKIPVVILNELEGAVETILRDLLAGGGTATHTTTASSSNDASTNATGNAGGGNGNGGRCGSINGGGLSSVLDVHRILTRAETELCNHIPGIRRAVVVMICHLISVDCVSGLSQCYHHHVVRILFDLSSNRILTITISYTT